jgi:hypothetical protein
MYPFRNISGPIPSVRLTNDIISSVNVVHRYIAYSHSNPSSKLVSLFDQVMHTNLQNLHDVIPRILDDIPIPDARCYCYIHSVARGSMDGRPNPPHSRSRPVHGNLGV